MVWKEETERTTVSSPEEKIKEVQDRVRNCVTEWLDGEAFVSAKAAQELVADLAKEFGPCE